MMKYILSIIITAGLVAISACSVEPALPPHGFSTRQPEINMTSTIEVIITAAANDGSARSAILQFFDHLHAGRYEEAVNLYGGSYQMMIDQNPALDPADHVALMKNACTTNGFQCLNLKVAGIDGKTSPNEYFFTVQFQNDDGSPFVLGPCCGASETEQPPVSLFGIRVMKVAEGEFRVLDMPPYMP